MRFAGQEADAAVDLHAALAGVEPEDLGLAGIGADKVQQDADGGGLAGPVRPEVAENLAGEDLDADIGDPQPATVVLRKALGFDDGCFSSA